MTAPKPRPRQSKQLDTGVLQPEISSFRLCLAAGEGLQDMSIPRRCNGSPPPTCGASTCTSWEHAGKQDVQADQCALWTRTRRVRRQHLRALQQFFKWLAAKGRSPTPWPRSRPASRQARPGLRRRGPAAAGACLRGPRVRAALAALIAVFGATGMRLSELAGIRYDAEGPGRSDVDLWHREMARAGQGPQDQDRRVGFDAARGLDRYLRVRARHAQHRPQLWLGPWDRGQPAGSTRSSSGAAASGVDVYPHRFRYHFGHTWLDRGRAEATWWKLDGHLPADAPPLRRQRPQREPAAATTPRQPVTP